MDHPFHKRLQQELDQRQQNHLYRTLQPSVPGMLNLSSNDYLQLRHHPQVIAGAKVALEKYGTGSGASPLLGGYADCHDQLLKALLNWKNKSFGVLFNTGFMANQAVLKHLPGPTDLILADRLIHHSMAQTLGYSPARFKRYHHLDLDHLEDNLSKAHGKYETLFVVTESVFSMDGDYPDLKRLVALKKKYPFILILDEAHGTGVFGPTGGGLAEEAGVLPEVDIIVGTLGKALASMGAYVLSSSRAVIDYLVNFSGELIYSTFLPPAAAGAALAALDCARNADDERKRIKVLSMEFREKIRNSGWITNDFDSPIVPVIIGDALETLKFRDRFLDAGIQVGAVRPPTVPADTSRLRISLHSGITEQHLEPVLKILQK